MIPLRTWVSVFDTGRTPEEIVREIERTHSVLCDEMGIPHYIGDIDRILDESNDRSEAMSVYRWKVRIDNLLRAIYDGRRGQVLMVAHVGTTPVGCVLLTREGTKMYVDNFVRFYVKARHVEINPILLPQIDRYCYIHKLVVSTEPRLEMRRTY